jgi:hypothetical protein
MLSGIAVLMAILGISAGPAAHASPGKVSIFSWADAATGRCLDSNYQKDLYTLPCNGGNYQNWDEIYVGNGQWKLRDKQTGLCLTEYVAVYTDDCDNMYGWDLWYELGGDYGTIFESVGGGCVLDSNANGDVYCSDPWARGNMYQNWY